VLIIRRAQMGVFEEKRLRRFASTAAPPLAADWPAYAAGIGRDAFEEAIYQHAVVAFRYGFRTENQLLRYVNLVAAFGGRFPGSRPWAHALLDDIERDGDSRLDLLVREAYGELAQRP
jgi:hypothetical protein